MDVRVAVGVGERVAVAVGVIVGVVVGVTGEGLPTVMFAVAVPVRPDGSRTVNRTG